MTKKFEIWFEPSLRDFVRMELYFWIKARRHLDKNRYRMILEFRWLADYPMSLSALGARFGGMSGAMAGHLQAKMKSALKASLERNLAPRHPWADLKEKSPEWTELAQKSLEVMQRYERWREERFWS